MKNYTQILRNHNLKATPQRLEITNALYSYGHISIESLYELMLKKFNSISLATIYKNINLMLENSFIQEVKLPNEKSVYEITKEAHSHMLCKKCHAVIDVSLDLSPLIADVSNSSNFIIEKSDLVLSGLCENCQ
jgi:Fur family transcriptional regulator, peroxide stress response regulator